MTGIQWTDETWNPVIGCRRVSEGCRNCYAEKQAKRIVMMQRGAQVKAGTHAACDDGPSPYENVIKKGMDNMPLRSGEWNGRAIFLPERLDQPLRWAKPRRVFVNSMSDLFHEDITFEQIAAVFGVMAASPSHTFQVLTKRPERALNWFEWLRGAAEIEHAPGEALHHYAAEALGGDYDSQRQRIWEGVSSGRSGFPWPLPNVWIGVSAEDHAAADTRIPTLLKIPAAVRFVSAEPLLGPIDFRYSAFNGADSFGSLEGLDWIIVGGESGPAARECDLEWIRSIVEQCRVAGVACFVKQIGSRPVDPTMSGCARTRGDADARIHHDCGLPECEDYGCQYGQRKPKHPKGGDPDEWPKRVQVREWPEVSR